MSAAHGPRPMRCLFHPFELAICGHSGRGKTTLIERLIEQLAPRRVGYAKHDAHRFEIDHEGKDTWRVQQAGAQAVHIHDGQHTAAVRLGEIDPLLGPQLFAACDLVLIEGWRRAGTLPRLLFCDGMDGEDPHDGVLACITADTDRAGRPAPPGLLAGDCRQAPVLHRDDLDGIVTLVREHFDARLAARPLKGLVLSGGHSVRMGRDKALIAYRGEPEILRAAGLLAGATAEVYLSVRPDQAAERASLGWPLLPDRLLGFGPLGGILSALESDPASAWLVLGCDMPFVDTDTLRTLLAGRDPWALATAFDSEHDGLPEPLCAIWEPRSRGRLLAVLAHGGACPRQALLQGTKRLPPAGAALTNINHPEEASAARVRLADPRELEVDPASADLGEFADWLLVDLREIGEPGPAVPANLPCVHRPLSTLDPANHDLPGDRELLLVCAHGRRSLWAAVQLRRTGLSRCWSLRGGLNGWAGIP
jgi:molybdenum cofactor guanylyltransferase